MIKQSYKLTMSMILSIVIVIIGICYWNINNTKVVVTEVGDDVIKLAKAAHLNKYSESIKLIFPLTTAIKKLNAVSVGSKKLTNEFLAAWKATDMLTQKQCDNYTASLTAIFHQNASDFYGLSLNQGMAIAFISIILIIVIFLVPLTNILRDKVGDPTNIENAKLIQSLYGDEIEEVAPPYSLARTQLLLWIVIISCIYIYAVFWDSRSLIGINGTALILMGISIGSFTVGTIIDVTEIEQKKVRLQDQPSRNFFHDILTDSNGISIHRFQNLVWTIIAVGVYFYRYSNPSEVALDSLPVLDSTLLALTGISSATYLTIKTRENVTSGIAVRTKASFRLIPDSSFSEGEKADLNPDKLATASVILANPITNKSLKALPVQTEDTLLFIADDIEEDTFPSVNVVWSGKLLDKDVDIIGNFDKMIGAKTPMPIEITIKKNK